MKEVYNSFLESGELFEFGSTGDENEFTGIWEEDKESFKSIYTALLLINSDEDDDDEDD